MTDVDVAVVFHSAYRGSTRALAEAVARGVAMVEGATALLVPVEQVDDHWDRLHAADAVVLGSPTYIGSVSAVFKTFVERLAGDVWRERMWLNKVASGFTVSAGPSGDKLNALQDLAVFAAQLGMIWVPVRHVGGHYATSTSMETALNRMGGYLGVMAQADIDRRPPDAPPANDLRTAELHGQHVASVARQLAAGRAKHPSPYPDRCVRPGVPATLWEVPLAE
ncbi:MULTISPECIES: flavodoxin family protein [unclassified Aeromicrobium]|uniref:flavodoxin family protein n=1 Tax=unclassified Aeromicrobium TaxID=2633570 RepID=UPI0009E91FC1|nr:MULTISPECIES: flavodoxin family protein [unclassified Aeromicrobium]